MGSVFPGAATADDLWRNVCAGVDAIGDVPADRWDPVFYDPPADGATPGGHPDRFYYQGPGSAVDAAGAPPLLAVDHPARELASGRCDLGVAGGTHHCHDVT